MGVAIRVIGWLTLIAAVSVPVIMYFVSERKARRGRS